MVSWMQEQCHIVPKRRVSWSWQMQPTSILLRIILEHMTFIGIVQGFHMNQFIFTEKSTGKKSHSEGESIRLHNEQDFQKIFINLFMLYFLYPMINKLLKIFEQIKDSGKRHMHPHLLSFPGGNLLDLAIILWQEASFHICVECQFFGINFKP